MRKGLLLSVAFLFYGEANAACLPELDCASLGYKYSYSQCGGKGLACLYNSGKYFCPETVSSCSYTYTAEDCAAECKNIGSLSCSKNGKTYYASCGSSKCSYNQTCNYGTCVTPAPSCTYPYTAQDCARQCKSTSGPSCSRNGTTYYQSCGSSKCSSGQTCENGSCISPVPEKGYCCGYVTNCGYNGDTLNSNDNYCQNTFGKSCYDYCMQRFGYSCKYIQEKCSAAGRTPKFGFCGTADGDNYGSAYILCE